MSGDAAIRIADDGNLRARTAEGKENRRKKEMGAGMRKEGIAQGSSRRRGDGISLIMQVAREVAPRDIRPVIIPGDAADKAMGTDEEQQLFITKKGDGIRSLLRGEERARD